MDKKVVGIIAIILAIAMMLMLFQQRTSVDKIIEVEKTRNTYCDELKQNKLYYNYDPGYYTYLIESNLLDHDTFMSEIDICIKEETSLSEVYKY